MVFTSVVHCHRIFGTRRTVVGSLGMILSVAINSDNLFLWFATSVIYYQLDLNHITMELRSVCLSVCLLSVITQMSVEAATPSVSVVNDRCLALDVARRCRTVPNSCSVSAVKVQCLKRRTSSWPSTVRSGLTSRKALFVWSKLSWSSFWSRSCQTKVQEGRDKISPLQTLLYTLQCCDILLYWF